MKQVAAIASAAVGTNGASIAIGITAAPTAMTNLRDLASVQPFCIKRPDHHPPRMYPTPPNANGTQEYLPTCAKLNPRSLRKYSGSQKMTKKITGSVKKRVRISVQHPRARTSFRQSARSADAGRVSSGGGNSGFNFAYSSARSQRLRCGG